MLRVVPEDDARQEFALTLDEICRRGAERMLAMAMEAEVDAYLERHREARDGRGHALVVRNGHARGRTVVAGAGTIAVTAPRVDDGFMDPATGERRRFRSAILPPYVRRSPKVAEVLPLLYLHGLSTKDFVPALADFFGTSAGLSAAAITRLTTSWSAERETFMSRGLSEVDYVYCWVDGIHFSVRLGNDDRLCVLVPPAAPGTTRRRIANARAPGGRHGSDHPGRHARADPPSPTRQGQGVWSAGQPRWQAQEDQPRCGIGTGAISRHGY